MLEEKLRNYNVILASQSPRRQTLLKQLGIKFSVAKDHELDETYPLNLNKFQIPVYLSEIKSKIYGELKENDLLITADTIVWMKEQVIGKPSDYTESTNMLQQLSGNMHEVITGVSFRTQTRIHSFYSHTEVYFANLRIEEIEYYVKKYKPYDKAGSYGIQEWIGYIGIERIKGSYFNVMGLPTQQLYRELTNFIT